MNKSVFLGALTATTMLAGAAFAGTLDGLYEAVIGAEVADALGYRLGQRMQKDLWNRKIIKDIKRLGP